MDLFDNIIFEAPPFIYIPPSDGGDPEKVIMHCDPLLNLVQENKKDDLSAEVIEPLAKKCAVFWEKISKITPVLQIQLETYISDHGTHSSFNNMWYISRLLNEMRFFGAYCASLATAGPACFVYIDQYSDPTTKGKRAVNALPYQTGVYFFLINKSKEVFQMGGTKGKTSFSLNEKELKRLLRRRKPRKGKPEFDYPSDYSEKVNECIQNYKEFVLDFGKIFW